MFVSVDLIGEKNQVILELQVYKALITAYHLFISDGHGRFTTDILWFVQRGGRAAGDGECRGHEAEGYGS